jgi:hypothetical protein
LKLHAKTFEATFSAIINGWRVDLGEIQFNVTYLEIDGRETEGKRLGVTVEKVTAEDVKLKWTKNILTIKGAKNLEIKKHHHNLYDPDQPKNLAKSVTVK